jgi:glycosyltransferase involved in cell wall biosynthesis
MKWRLLKWRRSDCALVKIAYLTAGAAGMFCGSCLHDNRLAAALLELGEDLLLVPTYTPLRTDEPDVSQRRIFLGGINVFLQQRSQWFRRAPQWLNRLIDHPALLGLLAYSNRPIDPASLGELTVSILRGESGNQHREMEKLARWLREQVQPDVVHLPNSMLLGTASSIAAQWPVPIVCSLSGEDLFVEKIVPPHYAVARKLLREQADKVAAYVTMNHYYADFMADYLSIDRDLIHVIPPGLELTGYGKRPSKPRGSIPKIGFFGRICPEKGLHLLVEACARLANRDDMGPFELHAAGTRDPGSKQYLRQLQSDIAAGPLAGQFWLHHELNREQKIAFYQSLDLLCTPAIYPESKGLPLLESMACAVPVVAAAHGAFPEMIARTEGGILFEPGNAGDLAEKIAFLLKDRQKAAQIGQVGYQRIQAKFQARTMAEQTRALYQSLLSKQSA